MRTTRRLGRYHLTELIASGGMAEVYRAFTFGPDGERHDIAIKQLLSHYVADELFLEMLTNEYRLVSLLRHPNIAQVYELTDVDGELLIAMEFVDGKDLRSTLERSRERDVQLDYDDIAYLMARALDGLHYAHEAVDRDGHALGLVHRDFSPANILVAYDGQVKIIDFGVAKAAHSHVQTKTGIIKGKIRYMSPEQAFGRPLDRRSDVFSAGSVLYELCTGRPAFDAPSDMDLVGRVRDAAPVPVSELNPQLPVELAEIIARAMARSRHERHPTAMALRDDLLRFLRRRSPTYRRTRLARFLKEIWDAEIERELRVLEELVLDLSPASSLGRNLLADTLGPDAEYARFHPHPQTTDEDARTDPRLASLAATQRDGASPEGAFDDALAEDALTPTMQRHPGPPVPGGPAAQPDASKADLADTLSNGAGADDEQEDDAIPGEPTVRTSEPKDNS